ncbi:hypothetical protein [Pandoraea terrae]|uniref:hypothetical protein n=1 Tax=Pandoraea terrae TaxID=1537710 RepID=UPI00124170B9|nr:hypothetical protein [Pandoraea terrae]
MMRLGKENARSLRAARGRRHAVRDGKTGAASTQSDIAGIKSTADDIWIAGEVQRGKNSSVVSFSVGKRSILRNIESGEGFLLLLPRK